jgi:hypothetical protein
MPPGVPVLPLAARMTRSPTVSSMRNGALISTRSPRGILTRWNGFAPTLRASTTWLGEWKYSFQTTSVTPSRVRRTWGSPMVYPVGAVPSREIGGTAVRPAALELVAALAKSRSAAVANTPDLRPRLCMPATLPR